jgi:hypothetical protein
MKLIIGLLLAICSMAALAQTPARNDGEWLRRGLLAWEKIESTNQPTADDYANYYAVAYYIDGVLDVQAKNSFMTIMKLSMAKTKPTPVEDAQFRTALFYSPLVELPDNVTSRLLKYSPKSRGLNEMRKGDLSKRAASDLTGTTKGLVTLFWMVFRDQNSISAAC